MPRYADGDLVAFAGAVLRAGGMAAEQVPVVADLLVAGDRLAHDTHGLALLPRYHRALATGGMRATGEPVVAADHGGVCVWDGRYLSGIWLVRQALDEASRRARQLGIAAVAIRWSHHTACLQAYLPAIVERGQVPMIMLTDPADRSVAPFGGIDRLLSSDPLAVGLPTGNGPVLVDMSTSITTNGLAKRRGGAGQRLGGPWLQDEAGEPTDDPAVLGNGSGSLLPLGGRDYGQKGTGLALIVEGLAQGLAGHGRADGIERWGASVYVQVIDPACFAGVDAFIDQTGFLADSIRRSRPVPGGEPVRVPGDGSLRRAEDSARGGVPLSPAIADDLTRLARDLALAMPSPVSGGNLSA